MGEAIKNITIEGFKSIRELKDFEFRSLNVLIGANGAGKSNFVGFFQMLRELIEQRLQTAVRIEGGPAACLYLGPKVTRQLAAKLYFGNNGYYFTLVPSADNQLIFADEAVSYTGKPTSIGSGHTEAKLKERKDDPGARGGPHGVPYYVFDAVSSWVVYHFHDTSRTSGVRLQGAVNDNEFLRADASNLAAFLYRTRQTQQSHYEKIRDVVRLAAPFFDDFKLRPDPLNEEQIRLEWLQKGSDYPFRASQLSDGTLRFICLATALLQPTPPATMLFDEPELGLHPFALTLLASLFQQAALQHGDRVIKQVIVSTQSALLLNEFAPEDVIIVERAQGQSTFRRLDRAQLSEWLSEYALGELWQKNVLGGRPRNEESPQLASASTDSASGDGR
jgi:predicted ATPase